MLMCHLSVFIHLFILFWGRVGRGGEEYAACGLKVYDIYDRFPKENLENRTMIMESEDLTTCHEMLL